ncbi:hypothetical protein AKJ38_03055 [candidate division MSBL1 archaeon SCGC-AAA259I14]|uniref:ABC transporter domain-containing protein n=1 Tax=candidate division MSBL1 archaeon SCGC-AAA259I14 TaxID=1698268 RepID=A0A133UQR1_9EURY|nr:hypothetical protein AKJ38_03055 [candidate division MSBL1 archaeon SCGC-AAA259I14]
MAVNVEGLVKKFPRSGENSPLTVFNSIDLSVPRGEFVCIVGPSGCGKSTLLNIINGIEPPTEAEKLLVLGEDVKNNPVIARKKMSFVFQKPQLLEWRTLRENILFALKGLNIQPPEKWESLTEKYLREVGLEDYMDYYPNQTSGGMQQRASIARAWANEPDVFLMDEPFSHLDEITARNMRKSLIDLWTKEKERKTIIFVTHDMNEAVRLADRVLMMSPTPSEIIDEKEVNIDRPRKPEEEDVYKITRELTSLFYKQAI